MVDIMTGASAPTMFTLFTEAAPADPEHQVAM
jgi:hypothetical protein